MKHPFAFFSNCSYWNVSSESRISLRRLFEVLAFLCELFVFAYLGLQVATMDHSFDFGLFFSGIPLAIASRFANVFPCSKLLNRSSRVRKLPLRLQNMLWAVGLRGAVAYGLVVNMPRTDSPGEFGIPAIETAALLVVVVSTLVLGSATGPLLRHLDLEGRSDAEIYEEGWSEYGNNASNTAPNERDFLRKSQIHAHFRDFDDRVLKPIFGGKQSGDSNNEDDEDQDSMYSNDAREGEEVPSLSLPLFGSDLLKSWYKGNTGEAKQENDESSSLQQGVENVQRTHDSNRNGDQQEQGNLESGTNQAVSNLMDTQKNNFNNSQNASDGK